MISSVSRRRLLKISGAGGLGAAALAIAGCGETQIVEVVKEVPVVQEKIVEKVVTQEVEVQKVVEVQVEKEKIVEKVVTVEAAMPKKAAVHLNFNTWWGTVEEYSAEVGEPFIERNPHVTIDWQVTPWGEYWQKMQTQAVSNQLPDFFGQSVAINWDWANKGLVFNMGPLIKRDIDESEHYTDIWQQGRYPVKGHPDQYMMPMETVVSLLYFNVDLFDDAGADYPQEDWTFRNWEEAGAQLTKKEGDKTTQFGVWGRNSNAFLDALINSNDGVVLTPDFKTCELNGPLSVEMIARCVSWIEQGLGPTDAQAADIGGGAQLFTTGRLGMDITGSWQIDAYLKSTDLNFDLMMVPIGPKKRVIYGGPDSWAISSGSPHFEDAWEVVKFAIGDERSYKNFPLGRIASNIAVSTSDEFRKKGRVPGYKYLFDSVEYMKGADFGPSWVEWRGAFTNGLAPAFLGEKSAQDSADEATVNIQAILDKVPWPAEVA
jgi:multiple sugar transport system substrate-binding protein